MKNECQKRFCVVFCEKYIVMYKDAEALI